MVSNTGQRGKSLGEKQRLRFQQASQAHSSGDFASAEAGYRSLIAEKVRVPQLYSQMAQLSLQAGHHAEAEKLWKKALEIDPAYVPARYQLGNVYKARGKLDRAEACYKRVMAQQATYTQAHFTYSGLHRYRDGSDPHIATLLDLHGRPDMSAQNRIHLSFALAKAFEDIGDYDRAFRYLSEGNRLRFKAFDYDISSDRELIENITRTFSREAVRGVQYKVQNSSRPIFIVGMPRSGTSLVEKILCTHPDVHGAGEVDYFFSLASRMFLDPENHYQFKPLRHYTGHSFEKLGRSYLESVSRLNGDAPRITDKLPFNLLMLGLVRLALPNAKIIHCRRDARDTCLSIYKQNFTTGNYRFAYDLETIGQFYNLYDGLMQHWQQVFPGAIYDISYEALTREPEPEIRKLLDACGLDWQPGCLDFNTSAGVVSTASSVQVRQPMYTSSVGLWEKYREFLAPLLDELEKGRTG